SGSSTGALNEGVDWGAAGLAKEARASGRVRAAAVTGLGAGGGCAVGLGTAIARGALGVGFTAGVSDAFGEPLCGLGDFSLAVFLGLRDDTANERAEREETANAKPSHCDAA